jgi:hypothetical protein
MSGISVPVKISCICFFEYVLETKKEGRMKDILIVVAIVVVWFVLNRYILPKMGVQT